ncbi:MAG TPA: hypothetical protein VK906_11105 [Egicoccus sp.]|nr:hypothetical protein [Egicoccus sp.]HSK23718.1 hypothetical protein [Egicoccus sp.]
MTAPSPTTRSRPSPLDVVAIALAAILQLGVGFITLTSGLVAPLWALVFLGLVWCLAVALLIRFARTRAVLTLLVPVGNAAVWVGMLAFGDAVLGWTA